MIAIGSCTGTDTGDFYDTLYYERIKRIDELICEIEILRDPIKLSYLKYWKRITKVELPFKVRLTLLTFVYVFIRPIIHIRVFSTLY